MTLTLAHLPRATKYLNQAGKFSTVVAWSGNNKLRQLLHLNSPPTLVVNIFKIKRYHNTMVAKIAILEICSKQGSNTNSCSRANFQNFPSTLHCGHAQGHKNAMHTDQNAMCRCNMFSIYCLPVNSSTKTFMTLMNASLH